MTYDVQAAVDVLFQGIVSQANLILAATERYESKGAPLDDSDVAGILADANALLVAEVVAAYVPTTQPPYPPTLPPLPPPLPRFPEPNPAPDGWSIVDDGTVVTGGRL